MVHVGGAMARGGVLMVTVKGLERLIGLISTLILVRLLGPADFGLVAMAMSIIAILEVMGAFGFDAALIQKQNASRDYYDTAWTLNILVFSSIALILCLLAYPAASFYQEPRLVWIIFVLALGSLFQGFENIGVVDFRKHLEFDKEFRFSLVKRLSSVITTIPLAFVFRNYWALVAGVVVGRVVATTWSYFVHSFRPRFALQAKAELFNFSKWLLVHNVTTLIRDRSSDFILGRISGASALGVYTVSHEVADLPNAQLSAPINRAVYPGLAKQADEPAKLVKSFLKVIGVVWAISLPAGAGIAITAEMIVPIALGDKWLEAVPIIQLLAISSALMIGQSNVGYVFFAVGRPKVRGILTIINVALLLPLLVPLIGRYGAVGAAIAHLIATVVFLPIVFTIVMRYIELDWRMLLSAVWRPFVATAIMVAMVFWFMTFAIDLMGLKLVAAILIGVVVYFLALTGLWFFSGRPAGPESLFLGKMGMKSMVKSGASSAG